VHQYLKAQILKIMKAALDKQATKSAILVTDDRTTKILDSVLKVHELNDLGIGVLVNIKFNRERVNVAPIYFLSPTLESIEAFCKDYSNPRQLQYGGSVHLFLCGSISEAGLKKIKASPVKKYLKTFQEVYCDFLALEDQVFYFNRKTAFSNIYMTKDQNTMKKELSEQAIQLFSTIVSMEENPYIRYAKCSGRAEAVAKVFQDYLNQMKPNMKGFQPREKRATVLIMDRSQDPIAPLTHEVTYQCMIKDHLGVEPKFLKLEDDSKENEKGDGFKRFYFRDDPLWNELRHGNMGNVVPDVAQRFKKFKQTNAVAQRDLAGAKPSLVQTVRDLPMYKKMAKSFSAHFQMTKILSKKFSDMKLATIGDLEQSLVTGIDPDGKQVNINRIQKELTQIVKDPNYPPDIKLRLLCIYIISQGGISEKQRNMLFLAANLKEEDHQAIYNLRRLGVTIKTPENGNSKVPRPSHYNDMQAQAKKLAQNNQVVQTRFEPLLSLVLRKMAADKLSEIEYPFIGEKPKMGSSVASSFGGRSHRKKNRGGSDLPRVIVFMVGGGSFNEVRQCYQLTKALNRPIYMGSSHFMSPGEYLTSLKGAEQPAVE